MYEFDHVMEGLTRFSGGPASSTYSTSDLPLLGQQYLCSIRHTRLYAPYASYRLPFGCLFGFPE